MLSQFFAQSEDDPKYLRNMAMFAGLSRGDPAGGMLAGAQAMQQAKNDAMNRQVEQLRMRKLTSEMDEADRSTSVAKQIADAARAAIKNGQFDSEAFLQSAWGIDPVRAISLSQALAKDNTPTVVAPGSSLWDKRKNAFVATAPAEPKEPALTELEKLIRARDQYAEGHPMRTVFDNKIRKETTHQPGTVVNLDNLGLKPKDRFEMEGKLSDDYQKATQMDRAILNATSKISTALDQSGALKDQAAIYAFAKALDPEGAVREADYAAISNSAGLIDRVRSYAARLLNGERLTPQQRQEMLQLAGAWEKTANARIGPQRKRFTDQAQRYNLNPGAVLDPATGGSTGWSITPVPGK